MLGPLLGQRTAAAPVRVGTTQRAVDVVTTNDGDRLLGIVTARDKRVVIMAIRRVWLEETLPERYERLREVETRDRRKRETEVLARIAEWRGKRAEHRALATFLDEESARLRKAFAEPDDESPLSEFVLVRLPTDDVRRVYVQTSGRRRAGLLAYRERLENVEDRAADALVRELRRRNVAVPAGPIDLSARLPKAEPTHPDVWEARVAAIEYEYVERLDFQGTGNVLVRTSGREAAPIGLEEVLSAFTKKAQPLNLLDLVDPPKGAPAAANTALGPKPNPEQFRSAIEEAEKRDLTGFRVTRVDPQLERMRVVVQTMFVAKVPQSNAGQTEWRVVWQHDESLDASQPRPELEERIAEDERVGRIFETIRALGVGGDAQLKTALRFGAATMAAQSAADDAFFEFIRAATATLDAEWPNKTNGTDTEERAEP